MTDKIVAFVVYRGLTPLDLIGPLQVMTGLEVVEGFAHQALDGHSSMLARVLGSSENAE